MINRWMAVVLGAAVLAIPSTAVAKGEHGKGKGKLEKMVIRREAQRVVFVDTPAAILLDIDIRLRL